MSRTTWSNVDAERLEISDGNTAVCVKQGGAAAAFGDPILASGRHSWTIKIAASFEASGDGMLIGVAEAAEDGKGKCWGLYPLTGQVYTSTNGGLTLGASTKAKPVAAPLRGGAAAGALVRVTADLDRHTLAFAVNDGSDVDSGVTLPAQIRPYALLCFEGDVLQFVES